MKHIVEPIGIVSNDRPDIANTDNWGSVVSTILVDERFGEDCLQGLHEFSHVDVLFIFDQTSERPDYRPRRPRGRPDLPEVGVFADRGPRRPNRIGVTTCRVVSVRERRLEVIGLDAVTGTPVIDIKPSMIEFQPVDVRQPRWVAKLMTDYFQP